MDKIYIPNRFKGRIGYQLLVDRYCRAGPEPPAMEGRRLKSWTDSVPDWWPDQDGEYRNEYFYGGNLQGIIQNLEYITKLSADLLYLSPISKTHTNHHYDVEDQRVIDPYIGTWDDFTSLCIKAHERNMLVAVDLVFNHMGAKSEFFQKALQGDEGTEIGSSGTKEEILFTGMALKTCRRRTSLILIIKSMLVKLSKSM